jgi:hypothetical protein
MKLSLTLLAVLSIVSANIAHAATYTYSGNTAGKPTMMVPGSDPGTDIQSFDAFKFQVSTAGSYGLVSSAGYDN